MYKNKSTELKYTRFRNECFPILNTVLTLTLNTAVIPIHTIPMYNKQCILKITNIKAAMILCFVT